MRGTATVVPPAIGPAPRLVPSEAVRRRGAILQLRFEVDALACPACNGPCFASWACLCALRRTMKRGEHSLRSKKIVELVALLLPPNYAEAAIPARIDFNSANTAGFTKWWSNPAADDNCRSDIWP